jgi:hypothetical protein
MSSPPIVHSRPPRYIEGPNAWRGSELAQRTDWLEELTEGEIAEIDAAVQAFKQSGAGYGSIRPSRFRLPKLGPRLERMLEQLLHGRGFVQIRGFPVEKYAIEDVAAAYLGVGSYLGSFRSQNAKGHLLGHVQDIGLDITDPNVRYYQTNQALEYHTDSCDIVGLMCLKTAKRGGESRIVSSVSLYNEMMARRPELAEALFHPYPTDRRGEIPEGFGPWFDVPVFNWHDGLLTTIYVGQYIRSAQANFPEARRLTPLEHEAIALLDELSNDPALNLQIGFQPGDMQFIHNHQILHARTDFEDWPEPERKRHLLRLWLSPKEGRALPACFAPRYGSLTPGERGGIIVKGTELTFALQAA